MDDVNAIVEAEIVDALSAVLEIDKSEFDPNVPFADFGVDSILAVEIANRLNRVPAIHVRTTDLFSYATVESLAEHILETCGQELAQRLAPRAPAISSRNTGSVAPEPPLPPSSVKPPPVTVRAEESLTAALAAARGAAPKGSLEIAIVGMSGRFPDARDVAEFWRNLESGRSSVKEITRWKEEELFGSGPGVSARSATKRGGLLSDIERFDPLFFNISPREAELMDPQQRLFLEEAWKAVEDAGYSDRELEGSRCGVFVGCGPGDYRSRLKEGGVPAEAYTFTGNSSSILAARISYFLNLKGPSVSVDTACSSSLVAMHLACESLRSGTSEIALVGGVAAMSTPEFFILATQSGMLNAEGECRAFDHRANGFVPGEGVGALILKPLWAARRDGDHIYGVIEAIGVNQDGKTNGITAPSAASQAVLEKEVYERYGIDPATITYVEAHGTGTKLGDPIEVEALTNSFGAFTQKRGYCGIGSVKTNIGHTLTAAGVAGVIKVLLSLKHKRLAPSLHLEKENPLIDFASSPFYVVRQAKPWYVAPGEVRRATVSSFGFSGTNAHVVIREGEEPARGEEPGGWHLVVLSGKTAEALERRRADLLAWLAQEGSQYRLTDIAYTLVVGRSHFSHREAFLVRDVDHLRRSLGAAAEGRAVADHQRHASEESKPRTDASLRSRTSGWMKALPDLPEADQRQHLVSLADLYVKGYDLEWSLLYPAGGVRRIPLPPYPFAESHFWVPVAEEGPAPAPVNGAAHVTVRLTGEEPYLVDHVINGRRMLPAAASLELARAAAQKAGGRPVVGLSHVAWLRPVVVGEGGQDLEIELSPKADGVSFQIVSEAGADPHVQGEITFAGGAVWQADSSAVDLGSLKRRCSDRRDRAECYRIFDASSVSYGPSFRVIQELSSNGREALSRLELPAPAEETPGQVMHPAMLDGALQTVIGLMTAGDAAAPPRTLLPHALAGLEIHRPIPARAYAHAVRREDPTADGRELRFDIRLYDEQGQTVAVLRDLAFRETPRVSDESQGRDDAILQILRAVEEGHLDEVQAVRYLESIHV
jgi:acyl transferase domain-containing protein/acyl carrier protein